MALDSRVVWTEGLFLRTQHFQQQDRWAESLVRESSRGLVPHGWGFRRLRLDTGLLTTGKLALESADGILPDGTPFAIPERAPHPTPLAFEAGTREGTVYLALPERLPGAPEVEPKAAEAGPARYRMAEIEVQDSIAGSESSAAIGIANPRFRLLREQDERAGWVSMGIARVKGVQPDGGLILDQDYLPPSLTIQVSPWLTSFASEVEGKLGTVAEARARYVLNPRAYGIAEVEDLLVLSLANRARPLFTHLAQEPGTHPERLFAALLTLAGEAATFALPDRRSPPLPGYRHHDLASCYRPLAELIRRLLADLVHPERTAVPIELYHHQRIDTYTTVTHDPQLFATATFYLGVRAQLPREEIRNRFPQLAKIGPKEDFADLVRSALPGIPAVPLPGPPPRVPGQAGMAYFELERSNPYWRKLPTSTAMALKVIGEMPGLELECWALRE